MVDASEKLANNHTHHTQSFCLAKPVVQLSDDGSEPRTVGKLESLSGKLVKRFARRSAMQSAISSAAAVLQSADEMEMAELNDPALSGAQPYNSGNLVGDGGSDAFVYRGGNRCKGVSPALHILSAWPQHRIEENRPILMAWLERHHVQDPIFSSESEIKSVQDQNQRPCGQAQTARSRYEVLQVSSKPPTQPLRSKTVASSESFQGSSVYKHCFQNSRTRSLTFAPTSFLADSPRTLAATALTTSRTKVINFCSATLRFRVPRMHARELHTD
jgi:hypothetical protein